MVSPLFIPSTKQRRSNANTQLEVADLVLGSISSRGYRLTGPLAEYALGLTDRALGTGYVTGVARHNKDMSRDYEALPLQLAQPLSVKGDEGSKKVSRGERVKIRRWNIANEQMLRRREGVEFYRVVPEYSSKEFEFEPRQVRVSMKLQELNIPVASRRDCIRQLAEDYLHALSERDRMVRPPFSLKEFATGYERQAADALLGLAKVTQEYGPRYVDAVLAFSRVPLNPHELGEKIKQERFGSKFDSNEYAKREVGDPVQHERLRKATDELADNLHAAKFVWDAAENSITQAEAFSRATQIKQRLEKARNSEGSWVRSVARSMHLKPSIEKMNRQHMGEREKVLRATADMNKTDRTIEERPRFLQEALQSLPKEKYTGVSKEDDQLTQHRKEARDRIITQLMRPDNADAPVSGHEVRKRHVGTESLSNKPPKASLAPGNSTVASAAILCSDDSLQRINKYTRAATDSPPVMTPHHSSLLNTKNSATLTRKAMTR